MHNSRITVTTMWLLLVFALFCPVSFAQDQSQALIEAARKGDLKLVQELLAKGTDVNAKGASGVTALWEAAQQGHASVVKLLLDKGADVNARVDAGFTPLMEAANLGHLEVTRVLLERGADPNRKDQWGGTALIAAARNDHPMIVQLLLKGGSDINAKDRGSWTALVWAVWEGYPEVVKLLLESGAAVNEQDSHGRTILMEAAARAQHLKTEENSPWYYDFWDQTLNLFGFRVWGPREPPSGEKDPEVIKLLMAHGADVNARDKDGWTALKRAQKRGHKEIVELLKSHGARE